MNSVDDAPLQFPQSSFAKAHLLGGPLYLEDGALWELLLRAPERAEITDYFRQIGLELVLDEAEGFAFLRQFEPRADERVPRLIRRQKLTYDATLLLVCLRDELNRFDTQTADQTVLRRTRRELQELVGGFLRESNNQVRDLKAVDAAIEQLRALGFIKAVGASAPDTFEVRRIIKARFGAGELEAVKERLRHHAEPGI
ncbi:MAG: DUF4194 domain-containing protein [Verrucomicrobia bacterium]|nr:DUF4194 domain-containing protein [Verrucomicrobiota bacterium]